MLICCFYYMRARRARAVRRILERMESSMPPPEVPGPPAELQNFSSVSVVICHVQPDDAQSELIGMDVEQCDMCGTQRMVGAAICSKCGRGLFVVAKPVDLEEEDRHFYRSLRDQVPVWCLCAACFGGCLCPRVCTYDCVAIGVFSRGIRPPGAWRPHFQLLADAAAPVSATAGKPVAVAIACLSAPAFGSP